MEFDLNSKFLFGFTIIAILTIV